MASAKMSGIYEIVNLVNGKRYIGSAVDIAARWSGHRHRLKRQNHHSAALQRAWDKYGAEGFAFRIICQCGCSELIAKEQFYIDTLMPAYNVAPYAGRVIMPAAVIEKRAATRRGKKTGPLSQVHRDAIGAAHKGRRLPPEHVEKIRQSKIGRPRPDLIGNKMAAGAERDEQWRSRMSAAQSGKKRTPEARANMRAAWVLRKAKT